VSEPESQSKQCRLCGAFKPIDDFYRMAGMRDGHRNECKACNAQLRKKRYNREREVERVREWRTRNPERYRAYRNAYQSRPDRKRAARDAYYRRTFGISADEFDDLLSQQGGVCGICGERPKRGVAGFHLDHDHDTSDVRGIVCQP
jgi:hypothetical protein